MLISRVSLKHEHFAFAKTGSGQAHAKLETGGRFSQAHFDCFPNLLQHFVGEKEIHLFDQLAAWRDLAASEGRGGGGGGSQGRYKGSFWRRCILKNELLPRQARDKHREASKKDLLFLACRAQFEQTLSLLDIRGAGAKLLDGSGG
jgi:hypothetical protein